MPKIAPVSDLRNYNKVLDQVEPCSPVYLTVNGRGKYMISLIEDNDVYDEERSMLKLLHELDLGKKSGEEEGYIPAEEVKAIFKDKGYDV